MRGDQDQIVAAVGQMALRARILRGGTFGNGQSDIVDHADLEPAIDAVAMARPDVEAAGTEGPLAPMFEGRTMRKARILVDEDARRLSCIHLTSSPFSGAMMCGADCKFRAFDAVDCGEVQRGSGFGGTCRVATAGRTLATIERRVAGSR